MAVRVKSLAANPHKTGKSNVALGTNHHADPTYTYPIEADNDSHYPDEPQYNAIS